MSKLKFQSTYEDGKHSITLELHLYLWEENKMHYVYSPSLDVTGYGSTEIDAKKSFEITLNEFVTYTHNKKTIFEELEHLGWSVNKKKKRIHAPDLNEMLSDNESFRTIYEKGLAKTEIKNIELELV